MLTSTASLGGRPTGAWLEEFAIPAQVFGEAGFTVDVASILGGTPPIDPASGSAGPTDTVAVADVDPSGYDAVFLVGGHGTMADFPDNPALARLLTEVSLVAAVCHGSAALLNVPGLVRGRTLTAFSDAEETIVGADAIIPFSLERRLAQLGAIVEVGDPFTSTVRRDGKLFTGQNPQSSAELADLVVKELR
ncbi:ThiJ/PfpI family protein [Alloactinosynnema sp. L-07]|nr:ThiJ/PfpI family protein [Alloactinosynnema sp. L-07]